MREIFLVGILAATCTSLRAPAGRPPLPPLAPAASTKGLPMLTLYRQGATTDRQASVHHKRWVHCQAWRPTRAQAPSMNGGGAAWDDNFRRRRFFVFAFTVVAYSAYYLVRNSIYYTAPAMVAAPDLAVDITSIGVISSVFPLTYGCSKFVSGVVGDVLSPRVMLASGLALTACVNIAFGCAGTLPWFVALWGLNGILQGWGGPACAKIITAWFGARERGTYWGARIPASSPLLRPVVPDRCTHEKRPC